MKKIALLIFVIVPLHAGRVFVGDPKEKMNEMKIKIESIRTRLGYNIPPEEKTELLNFDAKLKLIKKFNEVWAEYILINEILKKSFTSNETDQKCFSEFETQIQSDKRRYSGLCIQGLLNLRRVITQLHVNNSREN